MIKELKVQITEYVDDWNPGWVKCVFFDAYGKEWSFVEKVPAITTKHLDAETEYPIDITVPCEVIGKSGIIITVDLEKPYGIAEQGGKTIFDVFENQLVISN